VAETRNKRGFVLIEVLVAVAVAGVILVALLRAFVGTWFGIAGVREDAEAMLIARNLIETAAPRSLAAELSQQGSLGRYSWALEVRRVPVAGAGSGEDGGFHWALYRIGVVVTAPGGRRTSLETSRLGRP
jgi:prepilin-type N-terminal cleavage/methylation domain-containing protein